jgi:hypothetical protein
MILFFFFSPGRSPVSFDSEIIMMNHVYKERFPKVRICFKGENDIPQRLQSEGVKCRERSPALKEASSRAWWRTPLIPALGRQRQVDF